MSVRILVIEDDPDIANLLTKFLVQAGLAVQHEGDGERGLSTFLGGDFDVVLIDGLLPKKNGFEIAKEIRRSPQGKRVGLVMVSAAFRSGGARKEAYEAGFDAFFAKPFIVRDLFSKITELARQYRDKQTPSRAEARAARLAAAKDPPASEEVVYVRAEPETESAASSSASGPPAADLSPSVSGARPPSPRRDRSGRSSEATELTTPERPTPLRAAADAPWRMMAVARTGATGRLVFRSGGGELEIAYRDGVVVGAEDNLRENRFGEHLLRTGILEEAQLPAITARMAETQERFAEACVSLGIFDERRALEQLEQQAWDRIVLAASWASGTVEFNPDAAAADRLSVKPFSLVEAILTRYLEGPDPALVAMVEAELGAARLTSTPDFEPGLIAFAKLRPSSPLPSVFLGVGGGSFNDLRAVGGSTAGEELVAMRMAQMIRAPTDPAVPRAVPTDFTDIVLTGEYDARKAALVRRTLLRARGRPLYALIDVPEDAEPRRIEVALERAEQSWGRSAAQLDQLGPAKGAARELWSMLDEARRVLTDPALRAEHDRAMVVDEPGATELQLRVEEHFLRGRTLLRQKNYAAAAEAFQQAKALAPEDVDCIAYLGWATLLHGQATAEQALRLLEEAAERNPEAVRPRFFLGLAAAKRGDRLGAAEFLKAAARRAPEDRDVLTAMTAMQIEPPSGRVMPSPKLKKRLS